jgi:uncharacterized membrane protein YgcG
LGGLTESQHRRSTDCAAHGNNLPGDVSADVCRQEVEMSTASDRPRSQNRAQPPAGGRPILSPLRAVAAVCIIAPCVAMLWIPSYNKTNPKLLGFPFFYWYQLLWVVITAVLMVIAFQAMKRDNDRRSGSGAGSPGDGGGPGDVGSGGSDRGTGVR